MDFQASFENNIKLSSSNLPIDESAETDSYGNEDQTAISDDIMHDESSLDISGFLKMKPDIKSEVHNEKAEMATRKSQRLSKSVKNIEYIEMQNESPKIKKKDDDEDQEYMYQYAKKPRIKQDYNDEYFDNKVELSMKDNYNYEDCKALNNVKTEYESAFDSDSLPDETIKQGVRKKRYSTKAIKSNPDKIDITNYIKLRSAKGNELLCLDGFLYNARPNGPHDRTYWSCIKAKDRLCKCLARVITATTDNDDELRVIHIKNAHTHPISEQDIRRRLCNDLPRPPGRIDLRKLHIENTPLHELNPQLALLLEKRLSAEAKPKQS